MIPIFIVEEHHEAFFIWRYAILQQMIPRTGNALLHVDEHSDLNLPTLSTSLKELGPDLRDTLSFIRQNFGISEFILPAVYQGLFNEIYWMRRTHHGSPPERELNVFSARGEGRQLLVTNNFLQAGLLNPDRKTATLRYITPDTSVASAKSVIIDIDLDYFYCDYETGETFDVQITEQEYRAFCENPYHRLRMTSGGKLRAEERADGFYYVYQPGMIRETPEFSRKDVKQRISQFAAWLQEHAIEPALIDICRSRHSGYTPADQWSWIEEHLLEALKQNFVITVKNFDEVLKEQGVTEEFQCPRPGR